MIIGDPSSFALESEITRPYEELGHRALGFFVIHLKGERYGVYSPEATMLACSLDAVRRRIARRGRHLASFGASQPATLIVDAVRGSMYDDDRENESFFGMSGDAFSKIVISSDLIWAPDGDEAFDDGSFVLQFDCGSDVRLIAFRNADRADDVNKTIRDVLLRADDFYESLDTWQKTFEVEWKQALRSRQQT